MVAKQLLNGFNAESLTERFHMIRLACASTIPVNNLTRSAFMMCGEPDVSDSLAHTSMRPASSGLEIPIADWDDLFHAVQARLRDVVSPPSVASPGSSQHHAADDIRTIVLECVIALDQLHWALGQERKLHQSVDPAANAEPAATHSLAELVGMPAASLAIVQDPTLSPRVATFNASGASLATEMR